MVEKDKNGFGIASLACGLLSVVFFLMLINIPLIVAAVLFGILQVVFHRKKLFAILGMALAVVSVFLMMAGWAAILYGTSRADPAFMQQFQQDLLQQYHMDEFQ